MNRRTVVFILSLCLTQHLHAENFNLLDFGVVPDGKTICTDLIQNAIDKCSGSGGGIVTIPTGRYLTGTIILKSNVSLYLENGAVLLGSTNIEDYKRRNLFRAVNEENIAISGNGIIDGQGSSFWIPADMAGYPYDRAPGFKHKRPSSDMLIMIEGCKNVKVENVTLRGSESWTLHFLGCNEVFVNNITIRNPLHGPNTDGIDITACSNVRISNCDIYTRDDAIVLKNRNSKYYGKVNENITVTNCIITTVCNAFKIGTETMSDFRNIVFSNSVIKAAKPDDELAKIAATYVSPDNYHVALAPSGGIAIESVDGSNIKGITITNIVMDGVWAPIFIRLANRGAGDQVAVPIPGSIKDVVISNIVAYGANLASSISSIPGYYVENIMLNNIMIRTKGGGDKVLAGKILDEKIDSYPDAKMWGRQMPMSGFFIRHAKGIQFDNVNIHVDGKDMRPFMKFEDVIGLTLDNVRTNDAHSGDHLFEFDDVQKARLVNVEFPDFENKPWFSFKGKETNDIFIRTIGVIGRDMILKIDESVKEETIEIFP